MKIKVDVKSGVKEESVEKISNDYYLVKVKAQRSKGKANQALIKLMRIHFGKPIRIVSGFTSTIKTIEIIED